MNQNPDPITPKELFLSRREFLRSAGFVSAGLLLASCAPGSTAPANFSDTQTPFEKATHYNNYYEFSTSKTSVADLAKDFTTSPWQVEVSGLVTNPKTLSMDDILAQFSQKEHVYRMRCVEGWSMVLPWKGFSLNQLLAVVKPTAEAQYVSFESILRPEQMPGQDSMSFPWPYMEGLRLDEAMHDLTILATGMYDQPLTPQSGAPIRLVVPWKYGFKSLKAITKIKLVKDMPPTFWSSAGPDEYGFYANVNPEVDHPRWSQATELRIGETGRRPTLMFNGYKEVSKLYEGMDLKIYY